MKIFATGDDLSSVLQVGTTFHYGLAANDPFAEPKFWVWRMDSPPVLIGGPFDLKPAAEAWAASAAMTDGFLRLGLLPKGEDEQ